MFQTVLQDLLADFLISHRQYVLSIDNELHLLQRNPKFNLYRII